MITEELKISWEETFDENDNSVFEAASPWGHDEVAFQWRLCQRLYGNLIEWYDDSDGELRDGNLVSTWDSLRIAKHDIEKRHNKIWENILRQESK